MAVSYSIPMILILAPSVHIYAAVVVKILTKTGYSDVMNTNIASINKMYSNNNICDLLQQK